MPGSLPNGVSRSAVGRKKMISGTYLVSGTLLVVSAWLFDNGDVTANSRRSCGW
jgi:hypothetical protein